MLRIAAVSIMLTTAVAAAADVQPESTRKMAALLDSITRDADPMRNLFLRSGDKVPILREQIEATADVAGRIRLKVQLAQQLLQAGDPRGALQENESVERLMVAHHLPLDEFLPELLMARAVCYLRIGEQDNCLDGYSTDSCIFPIRGRGVYRLTDGARGAVRTLGDLLARFPGDLRARWLLNLAHMTLGEYPEKVPAAWLIPPETFASDYDIKTFPNVAGALGLDVDDLSGGVVLEDLDNDGNLDLMVSAMNYHSQLRYFRNGGDGQFSERTREAGLLGLTGGLNLTHCDYNNDGFADVIVLRGGWLRTEGRYPLSLLRNEGNGAFTDVTEAAGLLGHRSPTQAAACLDYNGDGWIDLFLANESEGADLNPCELYRNNGDGTFTECAAASGIAFTGFFKGVSAGDYNNDGRPDLLLSRLDGPKILLRNDGPVGAAWKFSDAAPAAGIAAPFVSFPCWFWDYDNDGWLDALVVGYGIQDVGDVAADYLGLPHGGQRTHLYRNNGDGTFSDVSRETGMDRLFLGMGSNFGDLDNDGWLDCCIGTGNPDLGVLVPNRMMRNDGGRRFQDVTTSGGFGQIQKGHGVAFGDINNDGAQDIYSVIGGAVEADHYRNELFANPGHGNRWLKLKLQGVRTNRAAIGARLKIVVRTGDGERAIHRVVDGNGSFGRSPFRQEIGLGAATGIVRVEIFWPVTGVTQTIRDLVPDRCYVIEEGADRAVPFTLNPFRWPEVPEPAASSAVVRVRSGPAPSRPRAQLTPELARYLDVAARHYGLQLSPTGLGYLVQAGRAGARPGPQDKVIVSGAAFGPDGIKPYPQLSFTEAEMELAATFPGLAEGVQMLGVDGRGIFVLPPSLSFGGGEWAAGVPRGSPIIYRITLHRVLPRR